MKGQNLIGLDTAGAKSLSEKLDGLLANYSVFYINVRGFHWNIKGKEFFELHVKFEELYNNLVLKIDEISERIRTLGFVPLHAYSDYLEISEIKEMKNISDGPKALQRIVDSLGIIISLQREILEISAAIKDEGTNTLMGDYITEQEKLVWMYGSYLGK